MKKQLLEIKMYDGLTNGTHIDVEVYYNKGGMGYLSGTAVPRGYYLRVTPVSRKGDGMVSYTLFSGVSKFLMPANRYTEKQFNAAVALGKSEAPALIARVLDKERNEKREDVIV